MKRHLMCALLALPLGRAQAQECPVVNGLFVTITTDSAGVAGNRAPGGVDTARTRTGARDTAGTLLRLNGRTVIDTTWRFNISERRWSRPYIMASVGAGWTGGAPVTGTTTAPDRRAWSACASAAVGMRDPTLVLRGARGLVRLRADLTSLSRLDGRARADSVQPRR